MSILRRLGSWLFAAMLRPGEFVGGESCLRTQYTGLNMKVSDGGQDIPVGIWAFEWPSALVSANIFRIWLRDAMGFDAEISGTSSGSPASLYAIAGCTHPDNYHLDPGCEGDQIQHRHHIALEIWESAATSHLEMFRQSPTSRVKTYGTIGYSGFESVFVFDHSHQRAWDTEGLALDFYRSYNRSFHEPSKYFSSYADIDAKDLALCNETLLVSHEDINNYFDHTGDEKGIERLPGGFMQARCWNNSWWFAPSCRGDPDRCVPVITAGNGWMLNFIMQAAASFSMPWAVAVASSWDAYADMPRQHSPAQYWWTPDTTFIDLNPKDIAFPNSDKISWATGDKSNVLPRTNLLKAGRADLNELAPRIAYALESFSITEAHMNQMLYDFKIRGLSYEEIACKWLQENEDTWRNWILLGHVCIAGQGLVFMDTESDGGEFLVNASEVLDERPLMCQWCPPGRFANEVSGLPGKLFVCSPCQPGTFVDRPGQDSCVPCQAGMFSDTMGATKCNMCGQGEYQEGEGASSCKRCPAGLTTIFPGAHSDVDCVCPEGAYAAVGSIREGTRIPANATQCEACGEGLRCPVGTFVDNSPCLAHTAATAAAVAAAQAASAADSSAEALWTNYPTPLEGFWLGCDAPTTPYRCIDATDCPGGAPQRCRKDVFQGRACGRCAPGFVRFVGRRVICQPCSIGTAGTVGLLFGALAFVAIVAAVLHLLAVRIGFNTDWRRPQAILPCLGYLVFAFLQILGIYFHADLELPDGPPVLKFTAELALDVAVSFRRLCVVSGWAPGTIMWFEVTLPLQALGVFSLVYFAAAAAGALLRAPRADPCVGLGNFGSLFLAGFVGVSWKSLSILHCYRHPGEGGWSLHAAPDVLCYSAEWWELFAPAAVAIVLCVGAPLALVCWVMCCAPNRVRDRLFWRRWGFLFVRFRPTAWSWTVVIMARGILCSVGFAFVSYGLHQLLWLQVVLLVYAIGCVVVKPWCSVGALVVDLVTFASLLSTSTVFAHYVPFHQGGPSAEQSSIPLTVFFAFPYVWLVIMCIAVVGQLVMKSETTQHYAMFARNLSEMVADVTGEEVAEVLKGLSLMDLMQIQTGLNIVQQEISLRRSQVAPPPEETAEEARPGVVGPVSGTATTTTSLSVGSLFSPRSWSAARVTVTPSMVSVRAMVTASAVPATSEDMLPCAMPRMSVQRRMPLSLSLGYWLSRHNRQRFTNWPVWLWQAASPSMELQVATDSDASTSETPPRHPASCGGGILAASGQWPCGFSLPGLPLEDAAEDISPSMPSEAAGKCQCEAVAPEDGGA